MIYFQSNGASTNYFPRHIGKFFKNLHKIYISHANTTTLSKDDLQFLGSQFKNLAIHYNHIEWLEADVFDFTPNLETVYLRANKIQYVEKGTFDKLKKLTYLNFQENLCNRDYASGPAVLELITNIEDACTEIAESFPPALKIRAEIEKQKSDANEILKQEKLECEATNGNLTTQINDLNKELSAKDEEITQLHLEVAIWKKLSNNILEPCRRP